MYTLACNESVVAGRVKAADNDVRTESSRFVYYLQPGVNTGEFELDGVSGQLYTVRPLDHEAAQSSPGVYTQVICVHVQGSPSIVDCTNVTVDVIDVNDNRPVVHLQV